MNNHLILLRHGQSQWNLDNRFTGWTDVDLSEQGCQEALEAGQRIRATGMLVDRVFTSLLTRAIRTAWIAQEEMDALWLPVERTWRLNERHYGALQGLNKAETAEQFGDAQVHIWRRSYDVPPPALDFDDNRHPRHDRRYHSLAPDELPLTESLKETLERVLPYWKTVILPRIQVGETLLVSAHGNSLRAMVKYLDNMSQDEIINLNIPTGVPLVYQYDGEKLRRQGYLG